MTLIVSGIEIKSVYLIARAIIPVRDNFLSILVEPLITREPVRSNSLVNLSVLGKNQYDRITVIVLRIMVEKYSCAWLTRLKQNI
jgi:hypothetical protein